MAPTKKLMLLVINDTKTKVTKYRFFCSVYVEINRALYANQLQWTTSILFALWLWSQRNAGKVLKLLCERLWFWGVERERERERELTMMGFVSCNCFSHSCWGFCWKNNMNYDVLFPQKMSSCSSHFLKKYYSFWGSE